VKEHAIVAALDHFAEVGVELDDGAPALELRRAAIFKPMLRALHAMEHALGAIGKDTIAFLTSANIWPVTRRLPTKTPA
jgi:hypothetical protein